MKKGFYIILIIVSICIIACGVIALNKKDKGVYLTDNEFLYDIAKEYLINQEKETSHDKDMPNFNSFIAYKGFGIQENIDKTEKYAYMWILQEDYYVIDNKLCSSTGSSMAYKFTFKDDKVVKYDIPEDGSRYTSSMKKMFPEDIYNKIISYDSSSSGELGKNIQQQLEEYYKGIDVSQKNNVAGTTFAGIIERNDTTNNTLYVSGFKDNTVNYTGKFEIKISDKTNITYLSKSLKQEDLKIGDTIKILFQGAVLETYPAQIDEVISITKYDSDKLVLLDAPYKSSGFVYDISKEDKEEISNIIKKSTFTNETCDGIAEYVFNLDNTEYGIEIFNSKVHITKKNTETVLNEEDSQKILSILNNILPHNDN